MKKELTIFVAALLLMVGVVSAITAEETAIIDAADRLVATQNSDGGWEWMNPDTDSGTGVPSPKNTIGVTAQGLLDAYKLTDTPAYLDAAIDAYGYMVAAAAADERMRGPDLPFLVELSEVTGNSVYADLAKTRYQDILTDYDNASGLAVYIRDVRVGQGYPTLVSWDLNLYVQGVLALDRYYPGEGFDDDADEITEVMYNFMYVDSPGFNLADETQDEYWLSHTGAIEAFTTTGLHTTQRDSLVTNLKDSQQMDGNFVGVLGGSDVQTTAYAVMALIAAGEPASATWGKNWLMTNQDGNGGWSYDGPENTEITSESIQAIFDVLAISNVGGLGSDFVALTVPDSIDYGTLFSTPGFETIAQAITLTNVGSLNVLVTPIWASGAEVFKHIKFSDSEGGSYDMITDGVGPEGPYTTSIDATWVSAYGQR